MKRQLFIGLYNNDLFRTTDKQKRTNFIKEVAQADLDLVKKVANALAWYVYAHLVHYRGRDASPVDPMAICADDRPEEHWINWIEKVEEILGDSIPDFSPNDLSWEEMIQELLLFKQAGVTSDIEMVNLYIDLF